MSKYQIVLFHTRKDDFLNRLQDLGLVDITTTSWEPDESERELMASIEKHRQAVAKLRALVGSEGFEPGKPYRDGNEAWESYLEASAKVDEIAAAIALAGKEAQELHPWGEFNPGDIAKLAESGVSMRFFQTGTKEFEGQQAEWSEHYNVVPINQWEGATYFVVLTRPGKEVAINAQEVKAPQTTCVEKEKEIARLEEERRPWEQKLARAASSVELIERHGELEQEELQFSRVDRTASKAADDTLVLMEGWAPKDISPKVDAMLEEYPELFYIKSSPTPEDDTPTLLKNSKTSSMYEIVGGFYSQPKYDTMDLTRWFGPFYALFFGLCLADAGYGLIYFVLGLVMMAKARKKPGMRNLANLVTILGFSTVVCGSLMDSFFGMKLTGWAPLAGLEKYLIGSHMFLISLALGVVQILLAMALKVFMYTKKYGFKYALSTIGWMMVIVTAIIPILAKMLKVELPEAVTAWSVPRLAAIGVGLFMMFFLNTPGKNPLLNFGKGLWNTYNDVVGFISDFLSYIRLFAIGLSGGILALVFNMLATGMSGNIPVLKQVIMILILLIGHGLTLFMSTISAFVHPMRLTFVEFYKNAGFEDTQRIFTPFKRKTKE